MKDIIRREVERALADCGVATDGFDIETPKRREFGDFSTNAAMTAAKKTGGNPRELAARLADMLQKNGDLFEKVEVAGPGFVNFFMKPSAVVSRLPEIQERGERFGSSPKRGENVLLEFVSANPTGPLHFGHARGAVVGDVLGNILEFAGYGVEREFYINDAGRQMELLGESVRASMTGGEIPADGYRGDYIKDIMASEEIDIIADEISREIYDDIIREFMERFENLTYEEAIKQIREEKTAERCGERAYKKLLGAIRDDLRLIGVEFDNWVSEKDTIHTENDRGQTAIKNAMKDLEEAGAVKDEDGARWFLATKYGDSQDWVLRKKDRAPTYFMADIAYHLNKFERSNGGRLINIWGADHHSHVGRLAAAMRALGLDDEKLKTLLIQFVRLVRDGKEEAMGKRAGSYVTLREVAELVGADATRFFLLIRAAESHLDFDLELAKKTSNENPVYYVQYAHARTASIKRKASQQGMSASAEHLELLELASEVEIVKILLAFPDVVSDSARDFAPHKIAFYLQGLASAFHSYYNANRVITEDKKLSSARLFLCECVATALRNGLGLAGVGAPERM